MEARALDVSSWDHADDEWLGDQPKTWLVAPGDPDGAGGARWLFKPRRSVELPGRRGAPSTPFTWFDAHSEWIAHQLADMIGVPSAEILLVRRGHEEGCLSRDVAPRDEELHSGDVFLGAMHGSDYIPNAEKSRNRRGHGLDAIGQVLDGIPGPPGSGSWSAQQVFAGYLVLDAWIGNSDRHADNWALTVAGADRRLAASFDHGSSLAAGVDDGVLARTDPRAYARGAMAQKFDGGQTVALVDLAHDALSRWGGPWLEALREVGPDDERAVVQPVPGMSDLRRTFICRLLEENRRRLLTS